MLSLCLVRCTFVVLGDPFSSATAFWWSLNWSLNRSLTVLANVGEDSSTISLDSDQPAQFVFVYIGGTKLCLVSFMHAERTSVSHDSVSLFYTKMDILWIHNHVMTGLKFCIIEKHFIT